MPAPPVTIQTHIPTGPLGRFVEALFFMSGDRIGTGVAFPRMNQTIIINLGSRFTVSGLYDRQQDVRGENSQIWINGKQEIPFMLGNRGTKVEWLGGAISTRTVGEIGHLLGFTRKRLRAEAQYYFGGSVKNVQGIIRLNHIFSSIARHPDETLSSLHDYYDQSHFINDFKARTGITPLQYKRLCIACPEIRYTPNFLPMDRETFLQFIF